MASSHAHAPVLDATLWRTDVALLASRTLAALLLLPSIALLTSRVLERRLVAAAIALIVYGFVALAATYPRLSTGWRVAAVLIALASLAFNIMLGRGLALNVGVLAGTFALLTLMAWGRGPAALAVGAWVAVLAVAAGATAVGSLDIRPDQGARQVLTSIVLWMALTTMAVVALSAVIARLEDGLRRADELGARLRSEARERHALADRLASEEEALRGDLARELHDDIGQRLTAVKITLETARVRRHEALAAACRESVRLMHDLVHDISSSSNLRPAVIDGRGIVTAMRTLVRRETLRAGVTAVIDIPDGLTIPDEAQMPCYRIVQEALTNAIRHARARRIVVRGTRVPTGVAFSVGDDGVGFDVEAARRLGQAGERLGLLGMRERAEGIGAHLDIVSSPETGTEIRLLVPNGGVA